MYNAENKGQARVLMNRIVADYTTVTPAAVTCIEEAFNDITAVMDLPKKTEKDCVQQTVQSA